MSSPKIKKYIYKSLKKEADEAEADEAESDEACTSPMAKGWQSLIHECFTTMCTLVVNE